MSHLLRVQRPVEEFAPLIEAARAAGLRVGWLELSAPEGAPTTLAEAARLGVLRAVAVGGGRKVAVKPMRGEAVLGDLLRENFLGCALVLICGDVDRPLLSRDEGGWKVEVADGKAKGWSTEGLVAALRRPRVEWVGGKAG